ncbi:MAG: hypothetical protein D6806_15445 [Deltaproteobacteria bacterium]|nr:MAG: hypothetical protein D6806_15445 [Deltaproteobacteria bacterium]
MMKSRSNAVPVLFFFLSGLSAAGCGEPPEPEPTYTLYGTITSTSVPTSGKLGWVKLVGDQQAIADPALYYAACLMQGPSCDYKINFVPEGNYTAFGIIDMDADIAEPDLTPSSGDLVSGSRPVFLFSSTRLDFPDSSWHSLP